MIKYFRLQQEIQFWHSEMRDSDVVWPRFCIYPVSSSGISIQPKIESEKKNICQSNIMKIPLFERMSEYNVLITTHVIV